MDITKVRVGDLVGWINSVEWTGIVHEVNIESGGQYLKVRWNNDNNFSYHPIHKHILLEKGDGFEMDA